MDVFVTTDDVELWSWMMADGRWVTVEGLQWMMGCCGRLVAAIMTARTAGTETQHTARTVARAAQRQ